MVEERGGVVEDDDIDAVNPEPTHERGGQVRHVSERGSGRSWFTKVHGHVDIAVRLGGSGGGEPKG
jgi:hypothetical protein